MLHEQTLRCMYLLVHAGFMEAVQGANNSEIGRRNGGAMLSAQGTERGLLQHLLARLRALDPDVLVGHNVGAFDLDVLLHRLQHHKVRHAQIIAPHIAG